MPEEPTYGIDCPNCQRPLTLRKRNYKYSAQCPKCLTLVYIPIATLKVENNDESNKQTGTGTTQAT